MRSSRGGGTVALAGGIPAARINDSVRELTVLARDASAAGQEPSLIGIRPDGSFWEAAEETWSRQSIGDGGCATRRQSQVPTARSPSRSPTRDQWSTLRLRRIHRAQWPVSSVPSVCCLELDVRQPSLAEEPCWNRVLGRARAQCPHMESLDVRALEIWKAFGHRVSAHRRGPEVRQPSIAVRGLVQPGEVAGPARLRTDRRTGRPLSRGHHRFGARPRESERRCPSARMHGATSSTRANPPVRQPLGSARRAWLTDRFRAFSRGRCIG